MVQTLPKGKLPQFAGPDPVFAVLFEIREGSKAIEEHDAAFDRIRMVTIRMLDMPAGAH